MHFLHKHICIATTLGSIVLFNACAPESKYNGGNGALRSYESMDAYGNNTIKYRQDYTQPTQSSFSSTLVANDRDNIRQTPQNNRATQQHTTSKKGTKSTQTNQANTHYEPPVKGDGSFTPTQSLLGGMRDSEAIQRATMRPYTVRGKTYRPHPVKVGDTFDGIASWYGPDFHAKATSNGETYNMHAHTAAHKTFPMNTIVKVYNKDNGKTTVVRINDRGPFVEGRIIDLSNVAAHDIAMVGKGIANVRVEVVGFGGDLVHNTPPKDSKPQTAPKQTTQQQVKHTESSPQPPKEQYTAPQQQNTILKPRQNTQVTHTESIPQEPTTHAIESTNINQTNNTTQTHSNTQSTDTYTMPTQDSKTQSINPQNTPQTESSNTNQTSNVANSPKVENKEIDTMPFEISEEELPEFEDTTQSKTKEAKHETKPKPQPTKDETLDSAFVGITPKHIDNTESIKDIDEAMQRLKDSTENLAKKAQNEIKNQAKENTQNTQQTSQNKTDSKVENTESKQPSHTDSKQIDSNNTATSDTRPSDTKASNVKADDTKTNKINKGNFMISLNVFSDENRAKTFKDDNQSIVKDTNYSIDIVPTDKGYRVALRGFKTYDEAKAFIAKYDIKGYVAQESK